MQKSSARLQRRVIHGKKVLSDHVTKQKKRIMMLPKRG